jgi:hypothetical protein
VIPAAHPAGGESPRPTSRSGGMLEEANAKAFGRIRDVGLSHWVRWYSWVETTNRDHQH